jgi:hypothetical protein
MRQICHSKDQMQPQCCLTMTHDIIGMMWLQNIMRLTGYILREQAKLEWTNLPSLNFHFYERQLVQMLLHLKFHTSQCLLQSCAAYTCRVEN